MLNEDAKQISELIACARAGMQKADTICKEAAAQRSEINELVPDVVDALVINNRIRSEEREKCAEWLRDPVMSLKLMQKLAAHNNNFESSPRLGKPAVKTASAQTSDKDSAYFGTLLGSY